MDFPDTDQWLRYTHTKYIKNYMKGYKIQTPPAW